MQSRLLRDRSQSLTVSGRSQEKSSSLTSCSDVDRVLLAPRAVAAKALLTLMASKLLPPKIRRGFPLCHLGRRRILLSQELPRWRDSSGRMRTLRLRYWREGGVTEWTMEIVVSTTQSQTLLSVGTRQARNMPLSRCSATTSKTRTVG